MTRPLVSHNIEELEKLFGSKKENDTVLEHLAHELQFRQSPRANTLLRKVEAALSLTAQSVKKSGSDTTEPVQHRLDIGATPSPGAPPTVAIKRSAPSGTTDPVTPPVALAAYPKGSALAMSTEDAYKVLGVTPASTWEEIEQIRRQLVRKTHPTRLTLMSEQKRAQAQAEAKRINTAYAALMQHRTRRS